MENVLIHYANKVATITLNRPDQLNAMNEQLLKELNDALEEVKRSDAQIVVLTGAGRAFSAGGDMKMMLNSDSQESFKNVMEAIKQIALNFYSLPKITIAKINGASAGLGLSLALAADFIIAKSDAKVAMNFIGIGLIPDGAGHFLMEQRLGTHKAKQTIWEGKVMTAAEAMDKGIIDLAVEENLDDVVEQRVNDLLASPILAMIESKNILHSQHVDKLAAILDAETKGQLAMRQTKDHQEGVQAFLEKRKPDFKGE